MKRLFAVLAVMLLIMPAGVSAQATPEASPEMSQLFGDAGKLWEQRTQNDVVVAFGKPVVSASGSSVPVAVLNDTNEEIVIDSVIGTARDAGGKLIGVGSTSTIAPAMLPAHSLAVGRVYFTAMLPADAALVFEVEEDSTGFVRDFYLDLAVLEANLIEGRLVGMIQNGSVFAEDGPIEIAGVCLDQHSALVGYFYGFAAKKSLVVGEFTPFEASLLGASTCASFVVGAVGSR